MPLCNKCVCLLTCSTTYSHFQMSTFHKGWMSMAMWQLSKGRSKAHALSVKPSPYLCSWPGWQTQLLMLHSPWSVCHDKTWNQWCATRLGLPYNEYTHTHTHTKKNICQPYTVLRRYLYLAELSGQCRQKEWWGPPTKKLYWHSEHEISFQIQM